MASLRIKILKHNKRVNGKHSIYFALLHQQRTCYIKTAYEVEDFQFENGVVVCKADASMINKRLKYLLSEYQEALERIDDISAYTCTQLKAIITNKTSDKTKTLLFSEYMKERIKILRQKGRENYAKLNEFSLTNFINSEGDITLKSISNLTINHFLKHLERKEYSEASQQIMLSHIKATINSAMDCGYVKYETHPFANFTMPQSEPRELDIALDDFIKIKNASFNERSLIIARDTFLLSFYFGGINLIDLLKVDFSDLNNDIMYVRTKTGNKKKGNNKTIIKIPEQAKPIIQKYRKKNGQLDFGYKFTYHNFSSFLTKSLKRMAKKLDITDNLVYYSARKTFAQFAFLLGIRIEVIEYCIGQSVKTNRPIYKYVRVMKAQADYAINKVIDYTENPEKYENEIEAMLLNAFAN